MSETTDGAGRERLLAECEGLLAGGGDAAERADRVVERVLAHMDCAVGTVHLVGEGGGPLRLLCQRGVPEPLLPRIEAIPVGKGMAGLAAERMAPVQVCNLQTDDSGVAKPAAKTTRMEGSLAVPMLVDGELRGVLGVAKPVEYEFDEGETALVLELGALLGAALETR